MQGKIPPEFFGIVAVLVAGFLSAGGSLAIYLRLKQKALDACEHKAKLENAFMAAMIYRFWWPAWIAKKCDLSERDQEVFKDCIYKNFFYFVIVTAPFYLFALAVFYHFNPPPH